MLEDRVGVRVHHKPHAGPRVHLREEHLEREQDKPVVAHHERPLVAAVVDHLDAHLEHVVVADEQREREARQRHNGGDEHRPELAALPVHVLHVKLHVHDGQHQAHYAHDEREVREQLPALEQLLALRQPHAHVLRHLAEQQTRRPADAALSARRAVPGPRSSPTCATINILQVRVRAALRVGRSEAHGARAAVEAHGALAGLQARLASVRALEGADGGRGPRCASRLVIRRVAVRCADSLQLEARLAITRIWRRVESARRSSGYMCGPKRVPRAPAGRLFSSREKR